MLNKALFFFISFLLVISLTFFLMHAIPGDPFVGDQVLTQEIKDSLYAYYGLDQPLFIQYFQYIKGLFLGDLGVSIVYPNRTVWDFIQEGFPVSFQLGMQALLLAIPLGVMIGSFAAIHQNKWQDRLGTFMVTVGASIPNFVIAALLQLVFAIHLGWLPLARFSSFAHTILPTITLSAFPIAFIARLTRSNMIEVMSQDYIRTAVMKGLSPIQVALKHGLKNALLPILAYLGPLMSHIFIGSFVVEKIFSIPGLGQWMVISIHGRDYPMVLGLTTFFAFELMVVTFFIECAYLLLDPRIQREEAAC